MLNKSVLVAARFEPDLAEAFVRLALARTDRFRLKCAEQCANTSHNMTPAACAGRPIVQTGLQRSPCMECKDLNTMLASLFPVYDERTGHAVGTPAAEIRRQEREAQIDLCRELAAAAPTEHEREFWVGKLMAGFHPGHSPAVRGHRVQRGGRVRRPAHRSRSASGRDGPDDPSDPEPPRSLSGSRYYRDGGAAHRFDWRGTVLTGHVWSDARAMAVVSVRNDAWNAAPLSVRLRVLRAVETAALTEWARTA